MTVTGQPSDTAAHIGENIPALKTDQVDLSASRGPALLCRIHVRSRAPKLSFPSGDRQHRRHRPFSCRVLVLSSQSEFSPRAISYEIPVPSTSDSEIHKQ